MRKWQRPSLRHRLVHLRAARQLQLRQHGEDLEPKLIRRVLEDAQGPQVAAFCEALHVDPGHLRPLHGQGGRGVDSGGERRRRPLLTQFTTPKQCLHQQRQILVRRHHARFLQRKSSSKRQQCQAVECGNGRAAQEARGPQVTAFCEKLRVSPASGLSPGLGEPPLRSVAFLPRSPGERRREVN